MGFIKQILKYSKDINNHETSLVPKVELINFPMFSVFFCASIKTKMHKRHSIPTCKNSTMQNQFVFGYTLQSLNHHFIMKIWTSLLFILFFAFTTKAQVDYKIKIKVKNYDSDTLIIGNKYGKQQYIKDTLIADKKGSFLFTGKDTLESGVFLMVFQPNKEFIEFLVDDNDKHFGISVDFSDLESSIKFKNSISNKAFQEYTSFLKKLKPKAEKIKKEIHVQDSLKNTVKKDELTKQLDKLDIDVKNFQISYIKKYKGSLPALIVRSLQEPDMPTFTGDPKEIRIKQYYFYRAHYFDNIDLADERLLHTNILARKIDFYVDRLIPQHPDTISVELDKILQKMEPNPEMYKFYLIQFLNNYAGSNIVGFDAIYVHLVNNYYAKGKTPWVDKKQMAKILRDASLLDPVLIGKTPPNITLYKEDGTPKEIFDVDKPYTLLFFWGPDCGHCKKAAPYLVDFYKAYKDQVAVITICNEISKKTPKCWEGIKDHDYGEMINLADPKYTSHFKTLYNVKLTPTIYILNDKKEIIMKRIPAKELKDVMKQLIEMEQKKKLEQK